jgi:uncharacterized protein
MIVVGLSVLVSPAGAQAPQTPPSFGTARTIDVESKATGASHRLRIIRPAAEPSGAGYPVVYLLDGSWYFDLAVEIASIMMRSGDMPPAIIVGVGYSDALAARRLRVRDFTTPAPPSTYPPQFVAWKAEPGGAGRFMAFMKDEVKPLVASLGGTDASCEMLVGHSLSGLFAADVLLQDPGAYASYAIGDPSVWWNDSATLKNFDASLTRLRGVARPVRVFLGWSTAPNVGGGILDFDSRLSKLDSARVAYVGKSYEGETHNSMIPGFLTTALRTGLKCGAPR